MQAWQYTSRERPSKTWRTRRSVGDPKHSSPTVHNGCPTPCRPASAGERDVEVDRSGLPFASTGEGNPEESRRRRCGHECDRDDERECERELERNREQEGRSAGADGRGDPTAGGPSALAACKLLSEPPALASTSHSRWAPGGGPIVPPDANLPSRFMGACAASASTGGRLGAGSAAIGVYVTAALQQLPQLHGLSGASGAARLLPSESARPPHCFPCLFLVLLPLSRHQ